MRFVSGTWYTGRMITKAIRGRQHRVSHPRANVEALASGVTTET